MTGKANTAQRKRVGVLISGRGSNMQALVNASRNKDSSYDVVHVISNRADAGGLNWANEQGITTSTVESKAFASREEFDKKLNDTLRDAGIELVACAGFMRILTADFVAKWHNQMLNIHPSLLPAFKGLNTHARALRAGVKITGCSVHIVSAELDGGPILGQAAVPVHNNDTAESLAGRVIKAEHRLYPAILQRFASGDIRLSDRGICDDSTCGNTKMMFVPEL